MLETMKKIPTLPENSQLVQFREIQEEVTFPGLRVMIIKKLSNMTGNIDLQEMICRVKKDAS